jgi:hypothetical protein
VLAEAKADLHGYLREARAAVLWKLDGLSDYDLRRPLTPTGTNLLGLVKHLGGIETGYFGDTFGRPFGEPLPAGFEDDAEPNAEFWATAAETREEITGFAETNRHSGHADIVRELIDGAAGLQPGNDNLPSADQAWWRSHRERLEHLAQESATRH